MLQTTGPRTGNLETWILFLAQPVACCYLGQVASPFCASVSPDVQWGPPLESVLKSADEKHWIFVMLPDLLHQRSVPISLYPGGCFSQPIACYSKSANLHVSPLFAGSVPCLPVCVVAPTGEGEAMQTVQGLKTCPAIQAAEVV